jgi:hypothetical protein
MFLVDVGQTEGALLLPSGAIYSFVHFKVLKRNLHDDPGQPIGAGY